MHKTSPWYFVPTLYFMEGLPFTIIVLLSTIMYKNLHISNSAITFYTGFLYLPWMLKPLWSWLIDTYQNKKFWVYIMEALMAVSFCGIALSLFSHNFFIYSLIFFWICAFLSASHDIAADGFYLINLTESEQAFFVGQQNLFYQIAKFFAGGILVFLSGILITKFSPQYTQQIWGCILAIVGMITLGVAFYHKIILVDDKPNSSIPINLDFQSYSNQSSVIARDASQSYKLKTIITEFFQLDNIWPIILFIMTFRIGENQLLKIVPLFMLDTRVNGGLALTNSFIGVSNACVLIAMIVAGVLGGITIARVGLKKCIWWMFLLVNIPHLIYVYLGFMRPQNEIFIIFMQVIENFATTFSLTAYAVVSFLSVKNSNYKTTHFAFLTAFKMLGIMLPSMFSGVIESYLGYTNFFVFVLLTMIPCALIIPFLKIKSL